jgi:hypothetical protein
MLARDLRLVKKTRARIKSRDKSCYTSRRGLFGPSNLTHPPMPRYSVANNEHCCFCVLDFGHCVPELNHHSASRDTFDGGACPVNCPRLGRVLPRWVRFAGGSELGVGDDHFKPCHRDQADQREYRAEEGMYYLDHFRIRGAPVSSLSSPLVHDLSSMAGPS